MKNYVLFGMIAAMLPQTASAQTAESLPLTRTCTVAAGAEKGQPRLVLVESLIADKATTYIQINGPTELSGSLETITIKVTPFDAIMTVSGVASKSYVRANVGDGWSLLLDRIRKGETMSLTAVGKTVSVSLAGSGVAVNSLERCSR